MSSKNDVANLLVNLIEAGKMQLEDAKMIMKSFEKSEYEMPSAPVKSLAVVWSELTETERGYCLAIAHKFDPKITLATLPFVPIWQVHQQMGTLMPDLRDKLVKAEPEVSTIHRVEEMERQKALAEVVTKMSKREAEIKRQMQEKMFKAGPYQKAHIFK